MTPPLVSDAAGWVGAVSLVAAYGATSVGRVRTGDRSYQLLNVLGSVGLGAVAWAHHTWPSLALNTLWLLIVGVTLRRTGTRIAAPPRPDLGWPTHTHQGAPPCQVPPSFPRSPTSLSP
jgi:hypothetical protein